MLQKWAQKRYAKILDEYWSAIEPFMQPGEQRLAYAPAMSLTSDLPPREGYLYLSSTTLYWGAYLGQGRHVRPAYAEKHRSCPGARLSREGVLQVASSTEEGCFAAFTAARGTQRAFNELCDLYASTLRIARTAR
ncbi:hypothetical protein [Streptomyces sp. NBC_01465]|uniref:hypothetical protein n=1 Tax=Streptomyces sp. NBC_01465 TaxID=2903878 RepID=UPI002E2F2B90|nr:hypothetical protein [Streptomyces sp. NBC_01465]